LKERGRWLCKRDFVPLGLAVFYFILLFNCPLLFRRVLERRSLSYFSSPSPYQGEGDKGDGVTNRKG